MMDVTILDELSGLCSLFVWHTSLELDEVKKAFQNCIFTGYDENKDFYKTKVCIYRVESLRAMIDVLVQQSGKM